MVLCTPSGMYLTSVTVLATLGTTIAGWIIRCTAVTTAPMVNMVASYLTTHAIVSQDSGIVKVMQHF